MTDKSRAKVQINNHQKAVKFPTGIRLLVRRCCNAVLAHEDFEGVSEISVSFVDNREIAILNEQYRNKSASTDVLSFPMGQDGAWDINEDNGAKILGDIVISLEKALHQSQIYGHSMRREIAFLTVHSMLHLLGYDHETNEEDAQIMRQKEKEILSEIGITRNVTHKIKYDKEQ